MRLSIILLFLCSVLVSSSYFLAGQSFSDVTLLSMLMAAASAGILLLLLGRSRRPVRRRNGMERWVVVDGSNVMHWQDNIPSIAPLRDVIRRLTDQGYSPGVVFDANAGYKLAGKYVDDAEFAKLLNLPRDQIFVVPKGTQADPFLLASARDLGARIVTNDRFRDWADRHPEALEPGFLIRGGYRDGALWLDDKVPMLA
jgi:Zc3h12a-like Ribonuclease NYN domain